MLINIDHRPDGLHESLGISEERNDQLKEGFKAAVVNCLDNGIASLKEEEDGYGLHISLSRLVEVVVGKLAQTPEELVLCTMYVRDVQERIEKHCELEAFKRKFQKEAAEEKE